MTEDRYPDNEKYPPVSVVIPTYNRAPLVERAVSSVLAQVSPSDEVIVIDDGSTDNTADVLGPFGNRITYRRTANGGVGHARNTGLALAKHSLAAFLDSDDEWLPGKLELQRKLMAARPELAFCWCDIAHYWSVGKIEHNRTGYILGVDDAGRYLLGEPEAFSSICSLPSGEQDFFVYVGDIYPRLMQQPAVYTQTSMIRRPASGEYQRFPEDINWSEDWEFFGRLAATGPAAFMARDGVAIHLQHGMPQLINSRFLYQVETALLVLQRVWGADRAFLAGNITEYEAKVDRTRILLARQLLRAGLTREARAELRSVGRRPVALTGLSLLPGPVVKATVAARRTYLKRAGKIGGRG